MNKGVLNKGMAHVSFGRTVGGFFSGRVNSDTEGGAELNWDNFNMIRFKSKRGIPMPGGGGGIGAPPNGGGGGGGAGAPSPP